jgi:hypothetical protein
VADQIQLLLLDEHSQWRALVMSGQGDTEFAWEQQLAAPYQQ